MEWKGALNERQSGISKVISYRDIFEGTRRVPASKPYNTNQLSALADQSNALGNLLLEASIQLCIFWLSSRLGACLFFLSQAATCEHSVPSRMELRNVWPWQIMVLLAVVQDLAKRTLALPPHFPPTPAHPTFLALHYADGWSSIGWEEVNKAIQAVRRSRNAHAWLVTFTVLTSALFTVRAY